MFSGFWAIEFKQRCLHIFSTRHHVPGEGRRRPQQSQWENGFSKDLSPWQFGVFFFFKARWLSQSHPFRITLKLRTSQIQQFTFWRRWGLKRPSFISILVDCGSSMELALPVVLGRLWAAEDHVSGRSTSCHWLSVDAHLEGPCQSALLLNWDLCPCHVNIKTWAVPF